MRLNEFDVTFRLARLLHRKLECMALLSRMDTTIRFPANLSVRTLVADQTVLVVRHMDGEAVFKWSELPRCFHDLAATGGIPEER